MTEEEFSREIQYVNLWMQQGTLFWSRQQTAAAIHTAGFAGWYSLKGESYQSAPCFLAFFLSCGLLVIIHRDMTYMATLRELGGSAFPKTGAPLFSAQVIGTTMIYILTIIQLMVGVISEPFNF